MQEKIISDLLALIEDSKTDNKIDPNGRGNIINAATNDTGIAVVGINAALQS